MRGSPRLRDRSQRGTAMFLSLMAIVITSLLGLVVMYVSSTERRLAAGEATVSKSFYSADSGIQWAAAEMIDVGIFFTKPEFTTPGYTEFRLPDHLLAENAAAPNIIVRVQQPGLLGRRAYVGGSLNVQRGQFFYDYELVSQSRDLVVATTKTVQADVEVGPLPQTPPGFKP